MNQMRLILGWVDCPFCTFSISNGSPVPVACIVVGVDIISVMYVVASSVKTNRGYPYLVIV